MISPEVPEAPIEVYRAEYRYQRGMLRQCQLFNELLSRFPPDLYGQRVFEALHRANSASINPSYVLDQGYMMELKNDSPKLFELIFFRYQRFLAEKAGFLLKENQKF